MKDLYRFAVAMTTVALLSSPALAQRKWDGFTKLSSDGLADGDMWADFDSWIRDSPSVIRDQYGQHFVWEFDKESFKQFYATELKQPKVYNRVQSPPKYICGPAMWTFQVDNAPGEGIAPHLMYCLRDDACKAALAKSLKKVACGVAYGPDGSSPKMTFDNGVLKVTMIRSPNGEISSVGIPGMIEKLLRKQIPAYEATASSRE